MIVATCGGPFRSPRRGVRIYCGFTVLTTCENRWRISADQSKTVSTLRRLGGEPVDRVQHPRLAAQAEGVSGLEQHRVAEGGQPALVDPAADPFVGVVEERLQLLPGEGLFAEIGLGFLHVHRRVPLVHGLSRVGCETLFAGRRPSVGGVGMKEQKDRIDPWQLRIVERRRRRTDRRSLSHSSTIRGDQAQGNVSACWTKARTTISRPSIVENARFRASCWLDQPSSIAVNTCSSGRSSGT
ncbi:hypothetical protein ABZ192_02560 [Streptomyces sp. NPDC006235]|uniref:hypothetical protein n=1 Tax=Streptomyces sp. NPDC006235 TaxID=3156736 RepID=UPI0033A668FD